MKEKLRVKIRELASILKAEDVDEIELRHWWTSLRVVRYRSAKGTGAEAPEGVRTAGDSTVGLIVDPRPQATSGGTSTTEGEPLPAAAGGESGDHDTFDTIVSPMVGTFYRAAAPDAEPFVSIGDRVEIGEVLCVIEAMKLMNEIEAECSGVIKKVLVQDSQPVEFGQPLFLVESA